MKKLFKKLEKRAVIAVNIKKSEKKSKKLWKEYDRLSLFISSQ